MILVTGGAGYIGSRLLPYLLAQGYSVRTVDTLWFDYSLPNHPSLEVVEADLAEFDPAWLSGVDHVIHLAGLSNDVTSEFAPELALRSNVQASASLAKAAAEAAARGGKAIRCLFASSCSVYYQPAAAQEPSREMLEEASPVQPSAIYSRTKRAAEFELLKAQTDEPLFCPVILRKGTVFGDAPRMRFDLVVNTFVLSAWSRRTLFLDGATEIWRPLLHIDDAVEAYLTLLKQPTQLIQGRIYNLLGQNYLISELGAEVCTILREDRDVIVEIVRQAANDNGGRSYRVSGERIGAELGIRPSRGLRESVLEIWDKLESGEYGANPAEDSRFFNIRWLAQNLPLGTSMAKSVAI